MGKHANISATLTEKFLWIFVYSGCSSTMLVINKMVLEAIPIPTVVSCAQLAVGAASVVSMEALGAKVLGKADSKKIWPFMLYTAMFAAGLIANMNALLLTNVGAVIATRTCLPVIVCIFEWAFLDRALPSTRSTVALAGVVGCAGLYIRFNTGVTTTGRLGYVWLAVWWVLLALQMTYGKWITEKIEMSQWERVFYNNACAIPPTVVISFATGEASKLKNVGVGPGASIWLFASCAVGTCLSYSGWKTRSMITATAFTLVGVLNKMAAIVFTAIVWPNDTTVVSIVLLVACILFGMLYQEAPKRKDRVSGQEHHEKAMHIINPRSP